MKRSDITNYVMTLSGESGHVEVLNIYNSQKDLPRNYAVRLNDPWCATFVSAVFLKYGWSSISECSCEKMIEKAKKCSRWVEDDSYKAQKGDIILYDWQDSGSGDNVGTADHVGIIVDVTDSAFIVREGNYNKTIGNRTVVINGKYIRGFITPPYEEETHKDKLLERVNGIDFDLLYKYSGGDGVKQEMLKLINEGY